MPEKKPTLSVVIPVYNESFSITHVTNELMNYLEEHRLSYELVFVNDGSTDDSGARIKDLIKKNPGAEIRVITFSRNFGKEAATTAGIHEARGEAILMFDADGQFPVELIEKFVQAWQDGAEVVVGVRQSNTSEGFVKRYGSKFFYRILNMLTDNNTVAGSTDFRLINREVADAFKSLTERNRITRGLIDWLGFKRSYVQFKAVARSGGKPTYSINKLVKLALHAFVSQSTRPLLFTGVLGIVVMAVSAVLGLFMVTERYILADPLSLGITGTAILAVFLTFLVGVVLGCQGLLALYIESIHNETQNRPLFVKRQD